MAKTNATGALRAARRMPVVRFLARGGFAVNGLVHVIIGYLAIRVAAGSYEQADPAGAFGQIASTPGGLVVLWAVALGFAVLGLWLILGAFLIRAQDPKKRALRMAIDIGKGIAYLALAAGAVGFAWSGASAGSGGADSPSAQFMTNPVGLVVVFLIGVGVLAVGVYFVAKGVRRRFTDDIEVPSGTAGKVAVGLGIWGYASKGLALGIVGVLFMSAVLTADPGGTTGLDGALKALLGLPFGPIVVGAVGGGFIAYGIYCFVRARYARL